MKGIFTFCKVYSQILLYKSATNLCQFEQWPKHKWTSSNAPKGIVLHSENVFDYPYVWPRISNIDIIMDRKLALAQNRRRQNNGAKQSDFFYYYQAIVLARLQGCN